MGSELPPLSVLLRLNYLRITLHSQRTPTLSYCTPRPSVLLVPRLDAHVHLGQRDPHTEGLQPSRLTLVLIHRDVARIHHERSHRVQLDQRNVARRRSRGIAQVDPFRKLVHRPARLRAGYAA